MVEAEEKRIAERKAHQSADKNNKTPEKKTETKA